ncbi:M48 family metalloprotease [Leptothoe sp. PORK10 BA2]|uniref:M48 family metalloprotease n=1 Tax=Leptothoe sp. PORK10 BA2 TaxID=3110254 RepID=UPI002B214D79|nr:M48 family metalloprotease [Leptothoe sp. PORK10 BA2]
MDLDRSPEQLIKAGLAAIKQKDYGRAIATFQHLCQTENISTSHRIKAQMGLIRTYEAQGDHGQAQTLCQPLLKSRSQSIRQWAHDKLQQLATDQAKLSTEQTVNRPEIPTASGFVPFNPTNETGTTSPTGTTEPTVVPAPPKDSVLSTHTGPSQTLKDIPGNQVQPPSLFHYQTLNSNLGKGLETGLGNDSTAPSVNMSPAPAPDISSTPPSTAAVIPHPPEHSQGPLDQGSPKQPQNSPTASSKHSSLDTSFAGPETWPQGSRLSSLKSLGKMNMGPLWFVQLATISILFFVIRWLVSSGVALVRNYIQFLDRLLPIQIRLAAFFWEPQTWTVIMGLALVTIVAHWLWPLLLPPSTPLTHQQLQTHSSEASQLLRRLCTKRRWPLPKIHLLASDLPLIFSYGWRPRYGQLVISQGLLDRLTADELAAVIVYELSHWSNLDWVVLSTQGLLLQALHRAYWSLAHWGEQRPTPIKLTAGALATVSYGIFWLLAQVGCGVARTRTPYRDRTTSELTGNPNGLLRALGKLSTAMAAAIAQQGYTPPLLESLALMLPVGPGDGRASIHHFAWGASNPLRHWLSVNQAHPPLGDRLYTLGAYGRHWKLQPSLNFAQLRLKNGSHALSQDDWLRLLLQGGAWSGLVLGLGVAILLWLVGAIATSLDFPLLAWLYKDRSILTSMPLIGAATGQLLRINSFFPEIAAPSPTPETTLAQWQTDTTLIPVSSLPIKINGTLTGRPALANWLGQEWRLNTTQGSIKLHHTAYLGPLSNINGLANWLQQPITVTGWFRRGHHIWIDIDQLRTHQNQIKKAQHPLWSSIISLLPLSYGLWLILKGV